VGWRAATKANGRPSSFMGRFLAWEDGWYRRRRAAPRFLLNSVKRLQTHAWENYGMPSHFELLLRRFALRLWDRREELG